MSRTLIAVVFFSLWSAGCSCDGLGVDKLTFACTTDSDCAPGFHCVGNVCRSGDAGQSSSDAGTVDAGNVDAGSVGQVDAGDVDAGQPLDAGDVDAGELDAGTDAGADGGSDAGLCFNGAACYQLGLSSTTLRYAWDGGAGCAAGLTVCGVGTSMCVGERAPQPEFCDGLDTDCDGLPDLPNCPCQDTKPCYQGPPGTIGANVDGKSICRAGLWACAAQPSQQCAGQVLPAASETCNGLDDDCDGLVDEAATTVPCGVGVCANANKVCLDGGQVACDFVANPPPGYSLTDTCGDGLDNNCNGVSDEGCTCVLDAGVSCFTGSGTACPADGGACLGSCARGTQRCQIQPDGGTGFSACMNQVLPGVENTQVACTNGIDDDCDGLVDCADPSCSGVTCAANGRTCTSASSSCTCSGNGGTPQSSETTCTDGFDNDCDGLTDCAESACAAQLCGANGRRCMGTTCACTGNGGAPQPSGETNCADGFDNDCDGLTDCGDPTCGAVSCGPNGRVCVGAMCACTVDGGVVQTNETSCNDGRDNDCDGLVDCADPTCAAQACGVNGRVCSGSMCTCGGGGSPQATETLCVDNRDNDCDGLVDCADPSCNGLPCATGTCTPAGTCSVAGCTFDGGVETSCSNNMDDNCNALTDCMDTSCNGQTCGPNGRACAGSACICSGNGGAPQATETTCTDSRDNDCDGLTDCVDSSCNGQACGPNGRNCSGAACLCSGNGGIVQTTETFCTDGADNDCDGLVDCADSTCSGASCGANGRTCSGNTCSCSGNGAPPEATETTCSDARDNDCDGLADCADPDCNVQRCTLTGNKFCINSLCVNSCYPDAGQPTATELACGNALDDDCDSTTDCSDTECLHKQCNDAQPASACCGTGPNATVCKNLGADPLNCGLCGVTCGTGSTCTTRGAGTTNDPFSGACTCAASSPVCPTPPGASAQTCGAGNVCTCNDQSNQCGNSGGTYRCTGSGAGNTRYCIYR